ncbi:hypothetical protein CR161_03880 [Prosthecochloris sp. ZM]|nr:hypothetical protein CR161_03880 [Prosthecochloris sp. ZM]
MWDLNSSWLKWMDFLDSQGACEDGPAYCCKYGDISIAQGMNQAISDPDFDIGWAYWVLKKSSSDVAVDGVRKGLYWIIASRKSDVAIAYCRKILLRKGMRFDDSDIDDSDRQLLLKRIFQDGQKRYPELEKHRREARNA